MPRNVEIKARLNDLRTLLERVRAIAEDGPITIAQEDTFFHCPRGRLKLRRFSPTAGELIYYERADQSGPKESDYVRVPCQGPEALAQVLGKALGVRGVIRKTRRLHLVGQTRIHLDTVDDLGDFLELEVVLRDDQDAAEGVDIARRMIQQLGIAETDLVAEAYIDLLLARSAASLGK